MDQWLRLNMEVHKFDPGIFQIFSYSIQFDSFLTSNVSVLRE